MDTEIVRTFLEVNRTRHFAKAAENLFVTQAAVSARIRQLEASLGTRLFSRARNNIQPTAAGHRLIPHAEAMLNAWNRVVAEAGAGEGPRSLFSLGCLPSLREIFLDDLLARAYDAPSSALLQVELLGSATLVPRVRDQSLNVGLLYEPPQVVDLIVERVATVQLALVSTTPGLHAHDELPNYVYVDWGTSFAIAHGSTLPASLAPILRVDTPSLAHRFISRHGGTAYLALRMLMDDLREGLLHTVEDAPLVDRPVYSIRSASLAGDEVAQSMIEQMKSIGDTDEGDWV
jgi:DNA-binding transcriptional LysR family regulator